MHPQPLRQPHLLSTRLVLEPLHPEADFAWFHTMATNPNVMRYISSGVGFTPAQSREFLSRQVMHFQQHGYARWRLTQRETGEFVGVCGAEIKTLDDERVPELGWWIAPQFWGQGYATEAATASLDHLWETIRLPRITACAYPENAASIRVMEKLGLSFEKHFWEHSPYTGERLLLLMHSRTR